MEHRNQQDVSIWLSHIQFLKTNGWEDGVSRLYLRLLQVHNDKPSLWIEAAKWEFENEGSAENARKILLRGLRLVGKIISDHLYLKYHSPGFFRTPGSSTGSTSSWSCSMWSSSGREASYSEVEEERTKIKIRRRRRRAMMARRKWSRTVLPTAV